MASRKKKWYAWTRIPKKPTVDQKSGAFLNKPFIKPGDEVTPEIIGITVDEFDKLIISGVIRSTPYPNVGTYEAPKQKLLKDAKKAMELAQAGGGIDKLDDDDDEDDTDDGTV